MSNKHILVLKASPRKKGNSTILADQAAEGARAAGAEVESFALHEMNIKPCDGCDACLKSKKHECIIKDDMQILYPKLRSADGIIIASPIYWFTISAQAKLCIDRWYALEGPDGNALAGKQFGIILTYGDVDPYASGAINAIRTFQDMFRYLGVNNLGFVYGSASNPGDVLSKKDLLDKAYQLGQKLGF